MYTVSMMMRVLPGKRDEFLQLVRSLHDDIKNTKGFSNSTLFQDTDDSDSFNHIVEWETQKDLDAYLQSELYKVLVGGVKILCSQSDIRYNFITQEAGRQVLRLTRKKAEDRDFDKFLKET
jgi:quinol monooxygenase YgiN